MGVRRKIAAGFAMFVGATAGAEAGGPARTLDRFVGEWKGSAILSSGSRTSSYDVRWICERGAGGLGVRCVLTLTGQGGRVIEEMDLIAYSPENGRFHWVSVCPLGVRDHKGDWVNGRLVLEHEGLSGDARLTETAVFEFPAPDRIHLRTVEHFGGRERMTFDATFHR